MKSGDLVTFNHLNGFYKNIYGYGLITSFYEKGGQHCWVLWFGMSPPCKKWCEVKDLELISDCR